MLLTYLQNSGALIDLAYANSFFALQAASASLATPSPFPSEAKGRGSAFVAENSRRAYRYFVEQSNPRTGLTKDRARNFERDSPDHVVASIAATGYALSAFAVGKERGWMPRSEAIRRTRLVLDTLEKQPRKAGWFYHWLNNETGAREWKSEVSTIDSGLLFNGMIVARQALRDGGISKRVDAILNAVDFRDMMTDGGAQPTKLWISMGWRPEEGYLKSSWDHMYENLSLNVLALGLDPKVPAASWDALIRNVRTGDGYQVITGGTLFMHQMSQGYIDFSGRRDRLGWDYWVDGRNATLAQSAYAARNPTKRVGYSKYIWAFSASDVPDGYGGASYPTEKPDVADESGTIAAPGILASMIYTPELVTKSAATLYAAYPNSYGRYGFSSGVNPGKDWRSPDVIGIDQGQAFVNIENARDGIVQKLFMSYPAIIRGLARAGVRPTSEGPLSTRKLRVPPIGE